MKKNNVLAASSEDLADIAIYGTMFEAFLRQYTENGGQVNPDITAPILSAIHAAAGPHILAAMLEAFVAGVNTGIDLYDKLVSNQTNIE